MLNAMSHLLTVYFDGLCRVCSSEIAVYQKRDQAGRVRWVDIMSPGFSAQAEGLDAHRVHREMHAKRPDGTLAVGVDAFIEIWKVIPGFAFLARVGAWSGIRALLDAGYWAFVRVRPYLPRKDSCDNGHCDVE